MYPKYFHSDRASASLIMQALMRCLQLNIFDSLYGHELDDGHKLEDADSTNGRLEDFMHQKRNLLAGWSCREGMVTGKGTCSAHMNRIRKLGCLLIVYHLQGRK